MTNEAQAGRDFIASAIALKEAAAAVGVNDPAALIERLKLGTAVAEFVGKAAPARTLTAARFEKVRNKDGDHVITHDLANGLEWDVAEFAGKTFNHEDAAKACADLRTGGHSDWRLPTRRELLTLVDDTRYDPAIDKDFFPNCRSGWYWTSTPYAPYSDYAWLVGFDGGNSYGGHRSHRSSVRAVRASQV